MPTYRNGSESDLLTSNTRPPLVSTYTYPLFISDLPGWRNISNTNLEVIASGCEAKGSKSTLAQQAQHEGSRRGKHGD